jgi:spore germination protein YaaH
MCMPAPRCVPSSKYACAEKECTRNSNPRLANPDGLIVGTDAVDVGPVYAVQKGDTLLSIAAMARTTVKSILHVNSDLAVSTHLDLQPGHDICLLLCTSVPLA